MSDLGLVLLGFFSGMLIGIPVGIGIIEIWAWLRAESKRREP